MFVHDNKRLGGCGMCLLLVATAMGAASEDRLLVEAVKHQDTTAVRALVDQGADVNTPQRDGATALHWAAHWNDVETADLLIHAGARVDATNGYGVTPLSLACTNGNAPMVDALLRAGANANATRTVGETVLMTCARTGNVDAVKALLAYGADVSAKEPEAGQTALMWAAAQDHEEIVRVLIEHGADVHARTSTKTGFTPLLFAARNGARDAVSTLLAMGSNVNEIASDGSSVLLVATVTGHWELTKYLLDHGADPNADGAGYTALHWAAGSWDNFLTKNADSYLWVAARGPGTLELVEALLTHGADPNARYQKGSMGNNDLNLRGATPFVLAAKAADVGVMRAVLAAGADPRLATDDGTTALMTAAGFGQPLATTRVTHDEALAAVTLALEAMGPDSIDIANEEGFTALHGAAYFGVDNVVQFLVDQGANINPRNKFGLTPLTVAEGYGGFAGIVIHEGTAALLRELGGVGGVDMPEMSIASLRAPCPLPTIYFPVRNPANYGNLWVTTMAATRYTNGSCADLKVGTKIRVKGVREIGEGKSWDGSVLASEIQIVEGGG